MTELTLCRGKWFSLLVFLELERELLLTNYIKTWVTSNSALENSFEKDSKTNLCLEGLKSRSLITKYARISRSTITWFTISFSTKKNYWQVTKKGSSSMAFPKTKIKSKLQKTIWIWRVASAFTFTLKNTLFLSWFEDADLAWPVERPIITLK